MGKYFEVPVKILAMLTVTIRMRVPLELLSNAIDPYASRRIADQERSTIHD